MHPANHTSADGLHSVWIARVTRFRQTPKSEPNSNFPLLVCFNGGGMAPGNMAPVKNLLCADEMFDYLGTAPEEAGVAVLAPKRIRRFRRFHRFLKDESVQEPHRIKVSFNGF
jgi:hypothetical protein